MLLGQPTRTTHLCHLLLMFRQESLRCVLGETALDHLLDAEGLDINADSEVPDVSPGCIPLLHPRVGN
jgi:hypothetical protein